MSLGAVLQHCEETKAAKLRGRLSKLDRRLLFRTTPRSALAKSSRVLALLAAKTLSPQADERGKTKSRTNDSSWRCEALSPLPPSKPLLAPQRDAPPQLRKYLRPRGPQRRLEFLQRDPSFDDPRRRKSLIQQSYRERTVQSLVSGFKQGMRRVRTGSNRRSRSWRGRLR